MEVEPSPTPVVAKKLWSLLRIVFFMLRKGLSKSKLILDLHLMLKRSKLAGKAIANNLNMLHHSSAFSCRSDDALSFVTPREYEFSCSNSPALHFPNFAKRNRHHHYFPKSVTKGYQYQYDDVCTASAVQKVLEMLNNEMPVEAPSPLVSLPGFGKSPMVRQLRITDSPFPLKNEGDSQVDKEADEFIKRFYKDLNSQKRSAAFESPSSYYYAMRSR